MESDLIFNGPNVGYWLALALLILLQSLTVGRRGVWRGRAAWPEERRWRLGFVTLLGSSLVMVWWFGWGGLTWAFVAIGVMISRALRADYALVGGLWDRREGHRWTLQYVAGYVLGLVWVLLAGLDLVTWLLMFASLGVCGAIKVGAEAYRESVEARRLRRRPPPPAGDDPGRMTYLNGTTCREGPHGTAGG